MTRFSGQEPEVLLPPGADEVPTDALALLPHRQRQALRLVDALLHKLSAAVPQEAAKKMNLQQRHLNSLRASDKDWLSLRCKVKFPLIQSSEVQMLLHM